jgi:threonyl-tRNA synthetase
MKILLLHSDFIEWEPKKKALKSAEEVGKSSKRVKEALVILTAVETGDEKSPGEAVSKACSEIVKVSKEVKAKNIVLYPYAHLSSDLAKPDHAVKIMKRMEEELAKKKLKVIRAPFGWYKGFSIKVKGHPLSELSKEIRVGESGKSLKEEVPEALKKEDSLKSEWLIIEPSGKEYKISIKNGKLSGYNFSKDVNLAKLARYEMAKSRAVKEEPPHIKMMRNMELVDYESASDPGNFRYFPKGRLVKGLIEDWISQKTSEYGAMEVETPIFYDMDHPTLKKYLNRFPARQYSIQTPNKNVFLRFAACFGQFLMASESGISYRNLPLRLYEMTKYSFRVEQRGELAGLRRLRVFTMPDCHAFCKDIEQAKKEMLRRFELSREIHEGLGLSKKKDFEFAVRAVKDFYRDNKKYVKDLIKKYGKPALVELWDKQFFYFVMKYEWNFIDALDKAATLSTDQFDVDNSKTYEIKYTDSDNRKKYPMILHFSPGAVERIMYTLLEKAYIEKKAGKNPTLPLWLSPTQVRLCPVSDEFLMHSEKIADEIESQGIRVDIDDRSESVGRKIRDSEMEWVPYIIVIGEREKSGRLSVRFRETGKVRAMSSKSLVKEIKGKTSGFPYKRLPLPRLLTKRPAFV